MTKKVTVVFEFEEIQDEYDEDYVYLDFTRMYCDEKATTLTTEEAEQVTESWAQSDFYSVGITTQLLNVLEGSVVSKGDIRTY